MNVNADCKGIPPDGNFKHLGQTYMMPRQYEAYEHLDECKGIPPERNFKHLGQTYMMPRQYEAYQHDDKCKGIPPERNYKHLNQTYMMPVVGELFKHDSRLACLGVQPQGNFMHLNQTYMMPRQYEAFELNETVGIKGNFVNPTVRVQANAMEDEKAFLKAGLQAEKTEVDDLSAAIVSNISSQLNLNLQKPVVENTDKKPIYASVKQMESQQADSLQKTSGIQNNFVNPNITTARLAAGEPDTNMQ